MGKINQINKDVKKPVEAIQCTNNFSLLQRKMYNVLLANAAGNLQPDYVHGISIGILCKLMGYKSHDYDIIKDYFRALMKITIEWDLINEKGNKVWTIVHPLSRAEITEGEGICKYKFDNDILPYLDRPAQYAKISLEVQSKFKSKYGLALYENCERYRNLGLTRAYDVSTFRKLMGVKDNEYLEFFALKRRVIELAIKEVNQHADYTIKPEYEKNGKQIVKIRFVFLLKKSLVEIQKPIADKLDNDTEISMFLKQIFGLSEMEIDKLFKKYEKVYIKEKVDYILSSKSFSAGEIENMAAYLKSALNSDYKPKRSSKEILDEIKQKESLQQAQQKARENELHNAKNSYSEYYRKILLEEIHTIDKYNEQEFTKAFETYLKENSNHIIYSAYKSKGYNTSFVRTDLDNFVRKFYPKILNNIISLDNYLQSNFPNIYNFYKEINER